MCLGRFRGISCSADLPSSRSRRVPGNRPTGCLFAATAPRYFPAQNSFCVRNDHQRTVSTTAKGPAAIPLGSQVADFEWLRKVSFSVLLTLCQGGEDYRLSRRGQAIVVFHSRPCRGSVEGHVAFSRTVIIVATPSSPGSSRRAGGNYLPKLLHTVTVRCPRKLTFWDALGCPPESQLPPARLLLPGRRDRTGGEVVAKKHPAWRRDIVVSVLQSMSRRNATIVESKSLGGNESAVVAVAEGEYAKGANKDRKSVHRFSGRSGVYDPSYFTWLALVQSGACSRRRSRHNRVRGQRRRVSVTEFVRVREVAQRRPPVNRGNSRRSPRRW